MQFLFGPECFHCFAPALFLSFGGLGFAGEKLRNSSADIFKLVVVVVVVVVAAAAAAAAVFVRCWLLTLPWPYRAMLFL